MRLLAFAFLLLAPASALAGICDRQPLDPEFPAGVGGRYEVIGKDPVTGQGYVGDLVIGYGKTSYALTRTIAGVKVHGDAWIERCGMDKIVVLVARYYTKPMVEVSCALGSDGDNYNRATCHMRQSGRDWKGLEAWFQRHE